MRKAAGYAIVTLGAVLLIAALLLFLHNRNEDISAGLEAESQLVEIQSIIPRREEETRQTEPDETAPTLSPEMPVIEIDGYGYVGYLSIPALELELPVMAEWDYERLRIAPCRQFGSSRTDDLVIAAHNYASHFGNLKKLEIGSAVNFTDMEGIENRYEVRSVETLQPTAVDTAQNSGYDLVLYTCTPGGASRVVAFCERREELGE